MIAYRICCLLSIFCLPGLLKAQGGTSIDLRFGVFAMGFLRFDAGTPLRNNIEPNIYSPLTLALRSEFNAHWTLETSMAYVLHRNFFSHRVSRSGNSYIRSQELSGRVARNQLAVLVGPSYSPGGNRFLSVFAGIGVGCFTSELYREFRIDTWLADGSRYDEVLNGHSGSVDYTVLAGIGGRLHLPINRYLGVHLEGRFVMNWTAQPVKDDPPFIVYYFPGFNNHVASISVGLSYHFSSPASRVISPGAQ